MGDVLEEAMLEAPVAHAVERAVGIATVRFRFGYCQFGLASTVL